MKKCPFCAEEILAEAKKCKHCQSSFDAPVSEMVKKKVTVQGALTEKGRKTNLAKASKRWESKGWGIVETFDGGLTGASYLLLEIEKGKAPPEINKKTLMLLGVVVIITFFISIPLMSDHKASNDYKEDNKGSTLNLEADSRTLKSAMETIADNVALKGGVKITTECVNLAVNSQVITFRCVSHNATQSVSFKQKFERDEASSIGWKPVWNDRVDKAISSLRGYSSY